VRTPKLSLGIGLTNACDLSCAHCYRPTNDVTNLGVADVEKLLDVFDVGSVNLGTGENLLNPALPAVLDLLHARGIRTSLTSNGLSLLGLDDERLRRLHDVEVSFDFATLEEFDAFRGPGTFDRACAAVRRCVALGKHVTALAVLMNTNFDKLAEVAALGASLGAKFRVNVYQPVHGTGFLPTWTQFWEGFARLFAATRLVTCTEPVVVAALAMQGADVRSKPCGCGRTSVRSMPDGRLLPCVYWPRSASSLATLEDARSVFDDVEFETSRSAPATCRECPLFATCGGGCPARRALVGALDEPDPFCPLLGDLPQLVAQRGQDLELLHAANVCTTIVEAS